MKPTEKPWGRFKRSFARNFFSDSPMNGFRNSSDFFWNSFCNTSGNSSRHFSRIVFWGQILLEIHYTLNALMFIPLFWIPDFSGDNQRNFWRKTHAAFSSNYHRDYSENSRISTNFCSRVATGRASKDFYSFSKKILEEIRSRICSGNSTRLLQGLAMSTFSRFALMSEFIFIISLNLFRSLLEIP